MSFFKENNGRLLKASIIGILSVAVITAVLLCVGAVVLNYMSGIPYGLLDYLTLACLAIGVLIGSYIAAAIMRSGGLMIGLIVGAVILLINLAFGFGFGDGNIGILTAIRTGVLLLCGAAGGIKGVNRKERIRIK